MYDERMALCVRLALSRGFIQVQGEICGGACVCVCVKILDGMRNEADMFTCS